jgi:hypothetical protein
LLCKIVILKFKIASICREAYRKGGNLNMGDVNLGTWMQNHG